MNRPGLLVAALLAGVASGLPAQMSPRDGRLSQGVLSFEGRATVGDFTGTTSSVSGHMAGGPELSQVRGWVEAPVNTLKTGNGRRDRDLNKSMESDKFPSMRFDLSSVIPGEIQGDSAHVTLNGTLTLHGIPREVALPAIAELKPEGLRLTATFPLNLNDYQIGGLSKMLGMLKMHPDIVVHVDLLFEQ